MNIQVAVASEVSMMLLTPIIYSDSIIHQVENVNYISPPLASLHWFLFVLPGNIYLICFISQTLLLSIFDCFEMSTDP